MAFNIRNMFSKQQPVAAPVKHEAPLTDLLSVMNFSRPEVPVIKESSNREWVTFGEANDYPQRLMAYTDTSAIHNAIVTQKALMVAGAGISVDGVPVRDMDWTAENQAVLNMLGNGGDDLHEVLSKVAMDYELFGAYALEVVWSLDFTRIVRVKHVDVSKLRSGKFNEDGAVDTYWYSRDWSNVRTHVPVPLQSYWAQHAEKAYNQIIYKRNAKPGFDYYGMPSYSGALSWIQIDTQLSKFHLSNIENGFNPSMSVKFYQKPGSNEEQQDIYRSIKRQFSGVGNTGKAMIFFSDGKELSPDIEPINVQNLDKQYISLAEQAVSQILSGHRVTSPELMGIAVPGKLGNSDLPTAYAIFNKTVIGPDRLAIEKSINEIARVNGIKAELTLTEFNPLTN